MTTLTDDLLTRQYVAGLLSRLEALTTAVKRLEVAPAGELHDRLDHVFTIADYAASEPAR